MGGGGGRIAKSSRYYANFTIRDLVCISMGYIFGFESRAETRSFSKKETSTTTTTRKRTRKKTAVPGNWDIAGNRRLSLSLFPPTFHTRRSLLITLIVFPDCVNLPRRILENVRLYFPPLHGKISIFPGRDSVPEYALKLQRATKLVPGLRR